MLSQSGKQLNPVCSLRRFYAAISLLGLLCGCSSTTPDSPQNYFNTALGNVSGNTQFQLDESLALLELCVDLDSQDDLYPVSSPSLASNRKTKAAAEKETKHAIYKMVDSRIQDWETQPTAMDSRVMVANDQSNADILHDPERT